MRYPRCMLQSGTFTGSKYNHKAGYFYISNSECENKCEDIFEIYLNGKYVNTTSHDVVFRLESELNNCCCYVY